MPFLLHVSDLLLSFAPSNDALGPSLDESRPVVSFASLEFVVDETVDETDTSALGAGMASFQARKVSCASWMASWSVWRSV